MNTTFLSKHLTGVILTFVLLFTIIAVVFVISQRQLVFNKAAASGVTLTLSPTTFNFNIGETKSYTLTATVQSGSPLEYLDYTKTEIAFDPQYLKLPAADYVTVNQSGLNRIIFLTGPTDANTSGKLIIELGALTTVQAPKTADQVGVPKTIILATINWQAQKNTPAAQPLTLGLTSLVTRMGNASQEIPVQRDTSTYTIGQAAGSPTPSLTPGGQPTPSLTPIQPTVTITPSPTGQTPAPTATPIGAVPPQCHLVSFYPLAGWTTPVSDFSQLKAGDRIRIAVAADPATASKAHIRVKQGTGQYTEWTETTDKSPNNEYFLEYQLPTGETTFRVEAEIFDPGAGVWR